MSTDRILTTFVLESNRIEGITGAKQSEVEAHRAFIEGPAPTVQSLQAFVLKVQPGALLRERHGMDVRVGNHVPPRGGEYVPSRLAALLVAVEGATPYNFHVAYETLHPFMDGNGRSGRALWAWQMVRERHRRRGPLGDVPMYATLDWSALHLGFLHRFYYQTLEGYDRSATA